MAEQVRETLLTTTFAIVDKTKPEVLYGEGTFADGASAEETAQNLNALLSAEARVYRAVSHTIADSLTIVGEDSEYTDAPARQAVQIEQPAEEPTAPAEAAEEPAEAPAATAEATPTPQPVPVPQPAPIPVPIPHEDTEEPTGEPYAPSETPRDPFAPR